MKDKHASDFRKVTKAASTNEDVSDVVQELYDASLQHAARLWTIDFKKEFYTPFTNHLYEVFDTEEPESPQPFNELFDFNKLADFKSDLTLVSVPTTPCAKRKDKEFKKVMSRLYNNEKRGTNYKLIKADFGPLQGYEDITFVDDLTWDGDHHKFVKTMWYFVGKKKCAAWLGRHIVGESGAIHLQPGLLSYHKPRSLLICEWLPGKLSNVDIDETRQVETLDINNKDDLPLMFDYWTVHPHCLFSEKLWKIGAIRLLPPDIHVPKPKKRREILDELDKLTDAESDSRPASKKKKGKAKQVGAMDVIEEPGHESDSTNTEKRDPSPSGTATDEEQHQQEASPQSSQPATHVTPDGKGAKRVRSISRKRNPPPPAKQPLPPVAGPEIAPDKPLSPAKVAAEQPIPPVAGQKGHKRTDSKKNAANASKKKK